MAFALCVFSYRLAWSAISRSYSVHRDGEGNSFSLVLLSVEKNFFSEDGPLPLHLLLGR